MATRPKNYNSNRQEKRSTGRGGTERLHTTSDPWETESQSLVQFRHIDCRFKKVFGVGKALAESSHVIFQRLFQASIDLELHAPTRVNCTCATEYFAEAHIKNFATMNVNECKAVILAKRLRDE